MADYLLLFVGTVLVNNFVLVKFLGLCPFMGVSKKLEAAMGMGLATTFVMTLASICAWLIDTWILIPLDLVYLRTLAFILVIAVVVQFTEMVVRKTSPALYRLLGIFLPLITTNCAVLRLRQARHGVNGCIISGIVLGSLYGLMPLWLNHQGVSDSGIGFWMAVMVSAGIVGQWPIGRLADRYGRLLVLRVQVFVVILGCLAMLSQAAMAPALFVLGASGFTLYPVAMAWACEKVERHQLVAMNQALLMSYTVGSLLGPTLTAMLMQNFSDNLLFIMIASVSFIYLLTLLRKAGHHPTPVAHA